MPLDRPTGSLRLPMAETSGVPLQPTIRSIRGTGPLPSLSAFNTGPLANVAHVERPAHETGRVLLIDDDTAILKLLRTQLSNDYSCTFVSNSEEALHRIETERFDIALIDIVMPKVSGIKLLQHMRAASPSTVVLLMTGYQDSRLAAEAVRQGAFDFLLKPFNLDDLELSLQRALRHKHLIDKAEDYQTRLESLVVERTAKMREESERLETAYLEMSLSFRATLNELATALEARDIEASGHTERVVAYTMRLGKQLGLGAEALGMLEYGALLHDIGLIFVSEDLLKKPTRLSDDEWNEIRKHTEYGARMLKRIGMLASAAPIVEQHHERWDGTGYPLGLRATEIDLGARIFAVADSLDAMLSGRPYCPARSMSEAASELLRCKGTQFDPDVVDAFFDVPVEEWERIRSSPGSHAMVLTGPLDGYKMLQ